MFPPDEPGFWHKPGDAVWRALMRNNIFYLLSALLMLTGCYIVCVPYLFVMKILSGLLYLLIAINAYEALVIPACAFLLRRLPNSREASTLLLVELLFLMDITFTINGCLPIDFRAGLLISVLSLMLVFGKIFAIESGAGAPVFSGVKIILFPALAFIYSFQPLLVCYACDASASARLWGAALWLAWGALPLLLGWTSLAPRQIESESESNAIESQPWWLGPGFRRTVALAAIVVPGLQLAGQSWVYRAPFALSFVTPLCLSLLVVLPVLIPKLHPIELAAARLSAIAPVLWLGLDWQSPYGARIFGSALQITVWRLDLAFAALAFLLMWFRERRGHQLDIFCLLALAAALGWDGASILRAIDRPEAADLAACAFLAGLYFSARCTYARALVASSAVLLFAVRAIFAYQPGFSVTLEFARYWALCAFLLSLVLRNESAGWRLTLIGAVFALGVHSYQADAPSALVYFCAAFAALLSSGGVLKRFYLYTLAAYVTSAGILRHGLPMEHSAANWGWIVIALAFAFFGLAFFITRRSLNEMKRET